MRVTGVVRGEVMWFSLDYGWVDDDGRRITNEERRRADEECRRIEEERRRADEEHRKFVDGLPRQEVARRIGVALDLIERCRAESDGDEDSAIAAADLLSRTLTPDELEDRFGERAHMRAALSVLDAEVERRRPVCDGARLSLEEGTPIRLSGW